MTLDAIIDLQSVSRVYRVGLVEVHALRGINLRIAQGERVAIMGPSGSGKTTCLNIIGTLDKPTSGNVLVDGVDISRVNEQELTKIRRDKISFIFQFFNLLPVLTAYENVELPLLIAGIEEETRRAEVDRLLELVGLAGRADHRPDELSGGEQQRVAIARALAKPPGSTSSIIILADEPTGDLDTVTGEEVMNILLESAKKEHSTLIVVTHDPDIGDKLDRVLTMRDGLIENGL